MRHKKQPCQDAGQQAPKSGIVALSFLVLPPGRFAVPKGAIGQGQDQCAKYQGEHKLNG